MWKQQGIQLPIQLVEGSELLLIWIRNMENCCRSYKIRKTTLRIFNCKLVDNAMFVYKNN